MFSKEIKELRLRSQLPQRAVASALDIDTATYCKIEKGERKAKQEHLSAISRLLNVSHNYLLSLWLADQIAEMLQEHQDIALDTLDIVKKTLCQNG
ncbi:helix-turn-helix transcriptional regulator [Porphyromonas endodontalis]|uniref:helix-turn-helix domain-containing protein n=1 Tax=Porphyromonas endodontalis TaxID=28124 RepID=UPI0028E4DF82|nr:helix-turn-helix transcriptional regulator [Porphyromonas endodontalis]